MRLVDPEVVGRIDERRVADPAVVGGQLDEVDARRPRADREVERRAAVRADHGIVTGWFNGHAVHERVAVRPHVLAPGAEGLERQRGRVGLDRQPRRARGDVALGREAGVDAEDPHDRRLELPACPRVVVAVRAPVAGRVGRRDPHQVRARPDRPVRVPGERVPARPQVRRQLVDRLGGADRRVTSKCTIARSLSVNEILADSRRPSPFGEIVVSGSCRPGTAAATVVGVDVHQLRGGPVDPQGVRGEDAPAPDEPDLVLPSRHPARRGGRSSAASR